jgi:septal ring factor EnvC (AmiA/AmiB activator)
MDQSEKEYIYQSAQRLLEHENAPKVFDDPYSDMTSEEKSKTILYLQEQQAKLLSKLDEMTASQDKMVAAQVTMSNTLAEASGKLSEANNQIAALLNTIQEKDKLIVALQEQIKLHNKQRFGATSQEIGKHKGGECRPTSRQLLDSTLCSL